MSNQDPVLEYQKGIPTSGWAVFIFIASLLAAAGFFLVIPAVLVFITSFAIHGSLRVRTDRSGAGLASAAKTISGISIILGLLTLVFLPSLGSTGRSAPRSTCAANLRGITQSMNVYVADGDWYPIVPFAPYTVVPNAPSGKFTGTSNPDAAIRDMNIAHPGDVQACM